MRADWLDVSNSARSLLFNLRLFHSLAFGLSISIALAIPLVQSRNINSVYDISYMITNWYRIAEGQIPYRDFILVHNPGSFIIGGLLFKVFGNSYYVVLSWMCFVNVFALVTLRGILTKIQLNEVQLSTFTVLLSFVLPYSVAASPNYDGDSTFAVLLCLSIFLHLISTKSINWLAWFSLGALSVLPFTIKQNIGVAFVISLLLVLCIGGYFRQLLQLITGIGFTLTIFALGMSLMGMLANWWNFSIVFAAKSRLEDPLIHVRDLPKHPEFTVLVLAILSTFCLYNRFSKGLVQQRLLGCAFILFNFSALILLTKNVLAYFIASPKISTVSEMVWTSANLFDSCIFLLFWAPWFFGLITSWLAIKALIYAKKGGEEFICWAMNLPLLLCLYSALLSQGLGSTYSNGSFLVLLVISSLKLIGSLRIKRFYHPGVHYSSSTRSLMKTAKLNYSAFLLTLTLVYGLTGLTGGRMAFVDSQGEKKSNTQIAWLKTPGEYLPDQEYAEEILRKYSKNESVVVFIPYAGFGYILADKQPLADVHTFDSTTNPYFSDLDRFLNCNLVDAIIYSSRMQVGAVSYTLESIANHVRYELIESVGPYKIFVLRKGINLVPEKYVCPSTSYSKRFLKL